MLASGLPVSLSLSLSLSLSAPCVHARNETRPQKTSERVAAARAQPIDRKKPLARTICCRRRPTTALAVPLVPLLYTHSATAAAAAAGLNFSRFARTSTLLVKLSFIARVSSLLCYIPREEAPFAPSPHRDYFAWKTSEFYLREGEREGAFTFRRLCPRGVECCIYKREREIWLFDELFSWWLWRALLLRAMYCN